MAILQAILFQGDRKDKVKLLTQLGYEEIGISYALNHKDYTIEIQLIEQGMVINKRGDYFHHLGKLIDRLGEITKKVTITDYP